VGVYETSILVSRRACPPPPPPPPYYSLYIKSPPPHKYRSWIVSGHSAADVLKCAKMFTRFSAGLRFCIFIFAAFYNEKLLAKRFRSGPSVTRATFFEKRHMFCNEILLNLTNRLWGPKWFHMLFLCTGCGDRAWYLRHSHLIRDFFFLSLFCGFTFWAAFFYAPAAVIVPVASLRREFQRHALDFPQ